MAECSDRKVKIGSRSLTEKGEELITKLSDYILKLTIDFSQEFTKNHKGLGNRPRSAFAGLTQLRFNKSSLPVDDHAILGYRSIRLQKRIDYEIHH